MLWLIKLNWLAITVAIISMSMDVHCACILKFDLITVASLQVELPDTILDLPLGGGHLLQWVADYFWSCSKFSQILHLSDQLGIPCT